MSDYVYVRRATADDVAACAAIAGKLRHELGFVRTNGLIDSAAKGRLYVADDGGLIVGFVEFNRPTRGENVGYSVVYHLAVHPEHRRRDIGRRLLYSVPHPVRLKCPVDLAANDFYRASGMRLISVQNGKARALNVWERRVLCIWVQGNNREIPATAKAAGMAYGTRHIETPRDWPFMLDIHWVDYDWMEYLSLVRRYRPAQAMVADYESPVQRETMLQQVADLRTEGVLNILVCPKFVGAVNDIPADCVIAVSVPSKYAGFVPPDEELAGRRIHLLGGSPGKQMAFIQRYGGKVVSLDGNAHYKVSRQGNCWQRGAWSRPPLALSGKLDKARMVEIQLVSARNICSAAEANSTVHQLALPIGDKS